MKQITPEEADAVIRASWPRPYIDTIPEIDYSKHTAECADCDEPRSTWMPAEDLAYAVAMVAGAVALVLTIGIAIGVAL